MADTETKPTWYETLGLSPSADTDTIKKRYRELARRWHPDVATAPDAAERFREITEAYSVLSDPKARQAYDAALMLEHARAVSAKAKQASQQAPPATSPNPPPPQRTAPKRNPEAKQERDAQAREFIRQSAAALKFRRTSEALDRARRAVRLRPKWAEAHEALGDALMAGGDSQAALAAYTIALQLAPSRAGLNAKLNKAAGIRPSGRTTTTHRRGTAQQPRTQPTSRHTSAPRPAAALGVVTAIGLAVGAFLLLLLHRESTTAAAGVLPFEWSALALLCLVWWGFFAGCAASLAGALAPIREELFQQPTGRHARAVPPLGAMLPTIAIILYWLALIIHLVVKRSENRRGSAVDAAFFLALLCAVITGAAHPESLLILCAAGGNITFPSLILGWYVGDRLRMPAHSRKS